MKVRRGSTALLPSSLRHAEADKGQMASTIWVDESGEESLSIGTKELAQGCDLPTRLSTKLTLRSDWRISVGGHPRALEPPPLRRGFCLSSAGKASELRGIVMACFFVTGAQCESHESVSEEIADTELSS